MVNFNHEQAEFYSPRKGRHLPTQSHHPARQSWKRFQTGRQNVLNTKKWILILESDMWTKLKNHSYKSPKAQKKMIISKTENSLLF